MTAAAPKTTTVDTPNTANPALDKRRAKWLATVQAVAEAKGALAGLDDELEAVARQREASNAALEAAVKRAAELEKELKALAKRRARLRADRSGAKRDVKTARRRSKVTEQKFDKALLVDLLAKAKSADLATNAVPAVRAVGGSRAAGAPTTTGTAPRRATAATRRSAPASAPARRAAATNGRSARS